MPVLPEIGHREHAARSHGARPKDWVRQLEINFGVVATGQGSARGRAVDDEQTHCVEHGSGHRQPGCALKPADGELQTEGELSTALAARPQDELGGLAPIAIVSRSIWASKSSSRDRSLIQLRWSKFSRQANPWTAARKCSNAW